MLHKRLLSTSPHLSQALRGKHALITGASRGIGLAIAQRFAKEGARCTLVGREEGTLRSAVEGLEGIGAGALGRGEKKDKVGKEKDQDRDQKQEIEIKHGILVGDVSTAGFWDGISRDTIKSVSILVNAAGISHASPFAVTSTDLLERVVDTNLMGTLYGSRKVVKGMVGRREGVIVNVASLLGVKGGRGSVGYAASKAGVIGMTRALAAEVGSKNVRVNVIVPGYIETDMTDAMTPQAHAEALNAIPLLRFGHTSEIADAAVFLATNEYANNCVLNLDGGLSAT